MCPNGQKLRTQKNIKNSSDTKTSGNMLVCVKKAFNIPSYFKRATLKIALVEGRSKLIRLMTCAFKLPLIYFMQVDVR
jgi:16S rRNA U516 pseudouridylate synthase RsuA-like enzyme